MTAIAQDFWQEQADEPQVCIDGRVNPAREDAYWQSVHYGESYYRSDCSYEEDYAPAYCAGYIGYAQYGGKFDDAEKSLCANWVRIKGDSRLTIDEAMQCMRAAWEHAAQGSHRQEYDQQLVQDNVLAAQSRQSQQSAYATA